MAIKKIKVFLCIAGITALIFPRSSIARAEEAFQEGTEAGAGAEAGTEAEAGTGAEAETEIAGQADIIFLLDCSQSMTGFDKGYMAFDFVEGLVCAAPDQYRFGVVGYNREICISLPLGSGIEEIAQAFGTQAYKDYGNAGAGLSEAVVLMKDSRNEKRIVIISDGENLMDSEENTAESSAVFQDAVEMAKEQDIVIDIVNLGERIEDENNVYGAAEQTGGMIYDLDEGGLFQDFIGTYLLEEMKLSNRFVGKLDGAGGELSIQLPDLMMREAKIILTGRQQNENLTINCEAESTRVWKGTNYTVIELYEPLSEDVRIRMSSDQPMDVNAYLTAEYDFGITTGHTYTQGTQTAHIWMEMTNHHGKNLLEGHLQDGGITVYLDGNEQDYRITNGKVYIDKQYGQNGTANLEVRFTGSYGYYFGDVYAAETIIVPEIEEVEEEEEAIDWFFWSVILVFLLALLGIFYMAVKKRERIPRGKKVIDESRMLPVESNMRKNDFTGKLLVYVIHNKDDIDYPPESINLFARCNREVITLEWILETCNLPLTLKGADKIIIKPGDDRSIIVKNSGKASAVKNREFLIKGHSYHLYYQEKVTFIFDEEDTEIEVHYKDLKPSER